MFSRIAIATVLLALGVATGPASARERGEAHPRHLGRDDTRRAARSAGRHDRVAHDGVAHDKNDDKGKVHRRDDRPGHH